MCRIHFCADATLTLALATICWVSMVTRHAGLAVRTGGEVATLFAHAAVHTRAVAVTLARCGRRYTERERERGGYGLMWHRGRFLFLKLPVKFWILTQWATRGCHGCCRAERNRRWNLHGFLFFFNVVGQGGRISANVPSVTFSVCLQATRGPQIVLIILPAAHNYDLTNGIVIIRVIYTCQ